MKIPNQAKHNHSLLFPFDSFIPITLFSICHFAGRWEAVFGRNIGNSKLYVFTFLGIVLLLGVLALLKPKAPSLRNRLVVAILVPYLVSVIAYFFTLAVFYIESGGWWNILVDGAVIALFFPYLTSEVWQIFAITIVWAVIESYRRMREG